MSGQYGANPEEIQTALGGTESSYETIMTNLKDQLKSLFIDKVANTWYGDDAIKFGGALKEAVDAAGVSMENIFSSINKTMNEAASAEMEGKGTWNPVSHSSKNVNTNVDSIINKRGDGFVGITSSADFSNCKTGFTTVKQAIDEAVGNAKSALANSGFYGAGDQEALNNTLDTIAKNVGDLFGTLEEDSAEALKATLKREEELSAARKSAFSAHE